MKKTTVISIAIVMMVMMGSNVYAQKFPVAEFESSLSKLNLLDDEAPISEWTSLSKEDKLINSVAILYYKIPIVKGTVTENGQVDGDTLESVAYVFEEYMSKFIENHANYTVHPPLDIRRSRIFVEYFMGLNASMKDIQEREFAVLLEKAKEKMMEDFKKEFEAKNK